MKLSSSLLMIPAASLLVVAAVGAGACSSSVAITTPTPTKPPATFEAPTGIVLGTTTCTADTYFAYESGFIYCDDGTWNYTDTQPTGFTIDTAEEDSASEVSVSGCPDGEVSCESEVEVSTDDSCVTNEQGGVACSNPVSVDTGETAESDTTGEEVDGGSPTTESCDGQGPCSGSTEVDAGVK